MRKPTRSREIGRGEKVLPGVWRLRLPLPWPGVPHCNAWALAAGPGVVLVDTGMHEPGSMAHLERALDQAGLKVEHVRLIVCTHAHVDHCGQAPPIAERAGCEVWMHANHAHHTRPATPSGRSRGASRSPSRAASPPTPCSAGSSAAAAWAAGRPGRSTSTASCVEGDTVETDLGAWRVIETPGHAPSHVCLYQPERRLLISGDHLLGRVSLYFDTGYTPDAVGEFLASLDKVEGLDARLAWPVTAARSPTSPVTSPPTARSYGSASTPSRPPSPRPARPSRSPQEVYGEHFTEVTTNWLLSKTLAWLTHLERSGLAQRAGEGPERWSAAA